MDSLWHSLAANLAVVALFISVWTHTRPWLSNRSTAVRRLVFGVIMGSGAIASMVMSIDLQPGILFDLRSSLLAISGFFGGPLAAIISCTAALIYRGALGGAGMGSGLAGIVMASAVGVAGHYILGRRFPSYRHVVWLAISVVVVTFAGIAILPSQAAAQALIGLSLPIAALCFIATLGAGCIFVQVRHAGQERELLMAAIAQAPDFTYIKNTASQFAAVNQAFARLAKFSHPHEMIGKTDFDISPSYRAKELFQKEQSLLQTGEPFTVEEFLSPDGDEGYWHSTSKVALRDGDNTIIGLVGVTRDVTEERRARQALTDSRNQLAHALSGMSDGLAMFDRHGDLVFSNDRYRDSFPLTGMIRMPGTNIRDILLAVVESGEQSTVPSDWVGEWIDKIAGNLQHESAEEVALFDGRWLQVKTRPTGDGASLVVVSDITNIKRAELTLLASSKQLQVLASTDGLTGLVNRRTFDYALEVEVAQCARTNLPLSLLMIDVDRFKAFNDLYGHAAGDECLKAVSLCLGQMVQQPADVAARYGGEEFAVILPATDEDGAYQVAEAFRLALRTLALPHQGSEKGMVTVSVGVATFGPGSYPRDVSVLVNSADRQLYQAKDAGRDRVSGQRSRTDRGKLTRMR